MSVGYEVIILGMVYHGILAFGIGSMWSLIPKKVIGLSGFVFFLRCNCHMVHSNVQFSDADIQHVLSFLCNRWTDWFCIWHFVVG
ncbi:hypothetical protein DRO59_09770 [Candidatus Bathyarchaeota archaeon]|nr:MAG: hypothetical protein DRO59_09770 [Candidatus Bathyarchaeota archaeon]